MASVLEVENTKDTKGFQWSTVSPVNPSAMVKVSQGQREQPQVKPKSLSLWKSLICKDFSGLESVCHNPKWLQVARMDLSLPVEDAAWQGSTEHF